MNGSTTVFVTDAGNREVLEYNGASGAIQRWYAYGLGSNDVLNQTNVVAGTRTGFVPDIQGSVIASIDSGSGVLSKIGYLPYGKSASAPGTFGYTAQRIDPETGGMYYYRARQYSPLLGRFIQTDPFGVRGSINLYAYVGNDPLNFVDPFGLTPDRPSASSASTIALPAAGASTAGAAVAAGAFGALAVVCVLVCPSQMGLDQPMLKNEQTPKEILMPGGVPIGAPGSDDTIRTLPGGQPAAEKLYGQLSKGGTPVNNPNYPGLGVTLPGGGFVGIRPISKSGDPAIDVDIPGVDIGKIHFP